MDFSGVKNLNIEGDDIIKIKRDGKTVWRDKDRWDVDDETVYQKTVPSDAVKDSVLKVGGRSVVVNQLANYTTGNDTRTERGITFTNHRDGSFSLDGTCTENVSFTFAFNITIISGHKYLINIEGFLSGGSKMYVRLYDGSSLLYNGADNIIYTCVNNAVVLMYIMCYKSIVYSGTNYPMLIDLTQMFGAGNEPSTVAEFKAMFPDDYYPYNTGEIKSAEVSEVVSRGKNLMLTDSPDNPDANYTSSGGGSTPVDYSQDEQGFYVPNHRNRYVYVDSPGMYALSVKAKFRNNGSAFCILLKSNGEFIGEMINQSLLTDEWQTFSRVIDIRNVSFPVTITVYRTLYFKDFQLEKASSATPYSPYTQTTYPIPSAVKALDGYGESNGSVVNYVDYENKEYHYFGKYVDGVWTPSATGEVVTDISSLLTDGFLQNFDVEEGGSLTFKNTNGDSYRLPVPVKNEFLLEG